MKLNRSKEWWLSSARREGDATIGAGVLSLDARLEPSKPREETLKHERKLIVGGKGAPHYVCSVCITPWPCSQATTAKEEK